MVKVFVLIISVMLLAIASAQANAQSAGTTQIDVCRDPRFETIRLEFHHIPADWFVWDGPSWGYAAMGVAMYADQGVLVADALEVDTDGWAAGTATIYTGTYSESGFEYQLTGDADTALCDVALSPVQDGLPIVLTPAPAAINQQSVSCPAVWQYPYPYCYTPQANGVIPIPPPI